MASDPYHLTANINAQLGALESIHTIGAEIMATLTEIAAQVRAGIVKERADHDRQLDELRTTLTDENLSIAEARDQALAALAAAQEDNATASSELVGLVDDLASNDLPDIEIPTEPTEPEEPTGPETPTDPETPEEPTEPETPGEEPETPTEPDDGTTEPPVLGEGDGDQPTNPPNPGEVIQ